nr:PAS domain-containing protein [Yersinia rochesterensis]
MNENLYDALKLLIHFFALSSEPWGAKDNQSKFIYANDKYKSLLALLNKFFVEGRFDGELPAPTAEFQTDFQQHDRKVELLQDRITSIEIHAFDGQSYFQAWFFDKYPLIDKDGVSQGTIFHGRPVDNLLLKNLYKIKIPTSGRSFSSSNAGQSVICCAVGPHSSKCVIIKPCLIKILI